MGVEMDDRQRGRARGKGYTGVEMRRGLGLMVVQDVHLLCGGVGRT